MTDTNNMYDQFSQDYDRFVNWDARLSAEIPFLSGQLASLQPVSEGSASILDAACGTGRHTIALADQGFDCAGADFSKNMIEKARENARIANHQIDFKIAGFGELTERFGENIFDGIVCLGNSLPHVLDESGLASALTDFRTVMRVGGKLILQNRNFDKVLAERSRWMPPQTYNEGESTWVFARFYDFDTDGRLTFNIQILYSQNGGDFTQTVISTRLWPMEKSLLVSFLKKAGFGQFAFYGSLEGEDYIKSESGNLVIVARAV